MDQGEIRMKEINIGILGCGTVGAGVSKLLLEKQALLESRIGARMRLKSVVDIDLETDRGVTFEPGVFTDDIHSVVNDPEVHIIVELIGGQGIAKDMILKAIQNGKHVITANKALLSEHGDELFQAAWEKGVDLYYEASVGGCMPVIKTIRESLVGNRIGSMIGILNGTCNYILTKITDEGSDFPAALAEAQAKGYAEAVPTLDVEGFDTAHKLAILNSLAYGMKINLNDIYIEGISGITPMDIEFAREFGYKIKLLAISKNNGDTVDARVHPTMIPFHNMLSNVNGSLNALTISGDSVDDIMLYGHGAGREPTASAVVSDITDIARNILSGARNRIPFLSCQWEHMKTIPVTPIDQIATNYYFRFSALDRPGVLSKIAGILGALNISIKSVHQKGRETQGPVPIVMLTHLAKEADVQTALKRISELDIVGDKPVLIRIEDESEDG